MGLLDDYLPIVIFAPEQWAKLKWAEVSKQFGGVLRIKMRNCQSEMAVFLENNNLSLQNFARVAYFWVNQQYGKI